MADREGEIFSYTYKERGIGNCIKEPPEKQTR